MWLNKKLRKVVNVLSYIFSSPSHDLIKDLDDLDMLKDRDRYDFLPTEKEKKEKWQKEQCIHELDSILRVREFTGLECFTLYIQKGIDLPYRRMYPDSVTIPIEYKSILIKCIEQSFTYQPANSNITYLRTKPSGYDYLLTINQRTLK